MNLAAAQRAFQAQILDEDIPLPEGWGPRMAAGLAIYRNAYRARLVEALKDTFPKTLAWIGEGPFSRAAGHYFITCPPSTWTLDMSGNGFTDTLGRLFANDPEVAELAWLEWAMHCAYVANDCVPIDAAGFAAATAHFQETDWSELRLAFAPGLACRPVRTACVAIWRSLAEDAPRPENVSLTEPAALIIWREGLSPVFRSLSALEAECLERMRSGTSFGAMCEFLAEQHGTERAAVEAGAMLGRWIDDGLIGEVVADGS